MKATFSFLLALFLCGNAFGGFSHEPETFISNTTNPPVFVSSNTQDLIGVYDLSGAGITMSSFTSQAMDADGIYYDSDLDILYQLNRTDNVINAYSGICDSLAAGSNPVITATSTSDFINGREIAVSGNKLVVAQDADPSNGNENKFFVYNITPTNITLERSFEVTINLWGFRILENTVFAIVDNSNQIAIFNNFFDIADGSTVGPTNVAAVTGITRTHGITYIPAGDRMILTDIGDAASDSDGALIYVDDFFDAIDDLLIDTDEQIRIEGPNTSLGNPVDVVFEEAEQRIFVAERANGGGKLLAFDLPTENGDATPVYSSDFAGASAVTFVDENINSFNLVSRFYASSNTTGNIGAYEVLDNGILQFSTFASGGMDADGIHYDIDNDVLYQLDRTNNVINLYDQVKASLDLNQIPPIIATSTANFSNGREIAVSNGKLVVAQDANVDNGMQNRLVVYDVTPTSITFDRSHDVDINLWGITTSDQVLFAVVDNSNQVALFDEFFTQPDGPLVPDFSFSVENIVRTHGIFYDFTEDVMYMTDIGDATDDSDGAIVIIPDFILSVTDINIAAGEQIRIEGGNTFLGNPVDIGYDPLLEIIFVAERANNGGAILGFEVPTQNGDFTPIYNSTFPGASAINVPYLTEQPVNCDIVLGGTVELTNGGTDTTIIVDGQPDLISFSTDVMLNGFQFTFVVTDDQGVILGIPPSNVVDFDPAGTGNCRVYGVSYSGELLIETGDSLLANGLIISDDCFDLSSNNLTIIRIADPCEAVSGGTVELAEGGTTTTIIVDGIADVIEFASDGATGDNFTYVVTDADGIILGIPPGNMVDFDPAGVGDCNVYGLAYTGNLNIMVGDDLFEDGLQISDDCFDLSSNNLTIIRIADPCDDVSGGTVELAEGGTTTTIIVDGIADVIEFASDGATGDNFTYVVTDADGIILGIPPNNVVDFDPAGVGDCNVYGLAYTGNLNITVGDDLFEDGLQISDDCFDLSSNNLTIIRIADNEALADLSISITASSLEYDIFENTIFTITVTNDGPGTATGVSVTAPFPDGFVYTSDVTSQGAYDIFTEIWNVGTLAPGSSATLELNLFSTVEGQEILVATEVFTSDQNDPDSTPNNGPNEEDDYGFLRLIPADPGGGSGADLSISITANDLLYENYENTVFTITVTNNGSDNATGVTVSAPLPEGFVYSSDEVSQGDYSLFFETWTVGSLDAGASATLELELFSLIEDVDVMVTTEVLTSDQDDPDSTPGNGPNGEDDDAFVILTPRDEGGVGTGNGLIDLELGVAVNQNLHDLYEHVDFVITITNNGPDAATNIAVHADVPEGLAYSSDDPSAGDYNLWLKRWTIASLDAGESATLILGLFTKAEGNINYFTEVLFVDQNDDDSFPGNGNGVTPQEDDEAVVSIMVENFPNAALNDSEENKLVPFTITELYPNPTAEVLTLEIESLVEQAANLEIYNSIGALIKTQPVFINKNGTVLQLAVGELAEGNYLIKIPGTKILKRFIKASRP